MAGDKQIKISFAVDETSARKAKSLIDDLTRSVEKLMRASSQSGGASFSNKPILPGSGGAGHRAATGAQKAKGPNVVANILGGDSRELQGMIRGTEQAFRTVSGNIRTFVGKAEQDISRLGRAVDRLNSKMGKMGGAIGGGGAGGLPTGLPTGLPGGQGSEMFGAAPAGRARGSSAADAAKKELAAAGKYRRLIGGIGGIGGIGKALPMLGKALPILGKALPMLGVARAGLAAYNFLSSGAQDQEVARLQYDINEPIAAQQRMATIASMGNRLYQAGRSGDFRYLLAERAARSDSAAQASIRHSAEKRVMLKMREAGIEDKNKIRQTFKRGKNAVTGSVESFLGESFGLVKETLTGKKGEGFTGFREDDGSATTSKSKMDIQREVFQKEVQADMAQDQMKLREAKAQLINQRYAGTLSRLYSGALSDVQVARSGFLRTGYIRDKEGNITGDIGLKREAKLLKQGWTTAQLAAANSALKRRAGFDYHMGGAVMRSQAGGFDNVVDVIRGGGVIGGSREAGSSMFRFAQSALGRKKDPDTGKVTRAFDISVGTRFLGGLIDRGEQMATRGDFGFTGGNTTFVQQAASLVNGGGVFDSAQQRRRAGIFNAGMQANNELRSKANIYNALNKIASISAAGGYGILSDTLETMDMQQLAGYAGGSKIGAGLKGIGLTKEIAEQAYRGKIDPLFLEASSLGAGYRGAGETGKTFNKLKDKYEFNLQKMLKNETSTIKDSKKREEEKQRILELLAPLAKGGLPALFASTVIDEPVNQKLGGGGAWGSGARGAQKTSLETQSEQKDLDAGMPGNQTNKDLRESGRMAEQGERVRESATASAAAGGIQAQTKAFSDAMSAMVRAIRGATQQIRKIK